MPGIALTQSYSKRIIYQPSAGRMFMASALEWGDVHALSTLASAVTVTS